MSKKRVREPTGVDVALVEIYEDLAHEDEEVRLKAAHLLLTKHLPNADPAQTKTILTRLFRGLCSSRKAARLGFSIALTEALSQLKAKREDTSNDLLIPSEVIGILEAQTTPDGSTSGQDERDHYLGRLFGSEAIIKSELLFDDSGLGQWERLLDLVCGVSAKKPWLRQECGWILYSCLRSSLKDSKREPFAVRILEKLNEHKMIRTPEGLASWIEVRRLHPQARLPKHVWKHNDPFSKKDLHTLADVLKDARASPKNETEFEVQGSATWSASLHFVWDIVLAELLTRNVDEEAARDEYVHEFWRTAVDEALFANSNSSERKHWGFQVMQKALAVAPPTLIGGILSKNAVTCLMQSLKSAERYLQRSAQKVMQSIHRCLERSPKDAAAYILSLFSAAGEVDFDFVTKTKTMENLLGSCGFEAALELSVGFNRMLATSIASGTEDAVKKSKVVFNLEAKMVNQQVNEALKSGIHHKLDAVHSSLSQWIGISLTTPNLDDTIKKLARAKLQSALEQVLKLSREGRALVLDLIQELSSISPPDAMDAEDAIVTTVKSGWRRFTKLHKLAAGKQKPAYISEEVSLQSGPEEGKVRRAVAAEPAEGLALLYGLTLFEIHTGDVEAVQILQDLLDAETGVLSKDSKAKHEDSSNADGLVEILLSFAARPSKFLRRLTLVVFEAFTPQITRDGIRSLTAILETKETKAGQEELFEPNGDTGVEEDEGSGTGEEDSDVELVGAPGSDTESDSNSTSDSEKDSDSEDESSDAGSSEEETQDQIADLLALEASLASALGTRKLTQDDTGDASSSDSDSDSDMTDSEMMALDDKLAEVFRNRAEGSKGSKRKDQKDARENIVNFKNRVLDMVDVYIKQEHLNPRSLDLILPLLELARHTNTKQLAGKAIGLLHSYCKRCSGLQNVPVLPPLLTVHTNGIPAASTTNPKKKPKPQPQPAPTSQDLDVPDTLALLRQIHTEAGLPGVSNAHRAACSQTSILLAKTLLRAGVDPADLVAVYAETRTRMLVDDACRVHEGFFVDWGNWCGGVRGKLKVVG